MKFCIDFFQGHCIVTTKLVQIWISKGHFLFLWRISYLLTYMNTFFLVWNCYQVITAISLIIFPSLLTWLSKAYNGFFLNWKRYKFHKVCDLVNQLVGWTAKALLGSTKLPRGLYMLDQIVADQFIWASEMAVWASRLLQCSWKGISYISNFLAMKPNTCPWKSLDARLLQSISYPKPLMQWARYRKADKENCLVMVNHINSPAEIIAGFQQSSPHI